MTIQMPVVLGIHSHPKLFAKVDNAIETKDFPVILDCTHTTFSTYMFYKFLTSVIRRVADGGGTVVLTNVSEVMFDALSMCDITKIVPVYRKGVPSD